MKLMAH